MGCLNPRQGPAIPATPQPKYPTSCRQHQEQLNRLDVGAPGGDDLGNVTATQFQSGPQTGQGNGPEAHGRTRRREGTRKEQTHRHPTVPDELDAPVPCSKRSQACAMARDCTVVPRSGRRGRRFKSCHPDHICAGHRPAARAVPMPVQAAKYSSRCHRRLLPSRRSVSVVPPSWHWLRSPSSPPGRQGAGSA